MILQWIFRCIETFQSEARRIMVWQTSYTKVSWIIVNSLGHLEPRAQNWFREEALVDFNSIYILKIWDITGKADFWGQKDDFGLGCRVTFWDWFEYFQAEGQGQAISSSGVCGDGVALM